ncbi:MAG TPA: 2-dehydropantoate 2-reductase [Candidatus Sulfotelmatobacter sp.]|nr:2-dehydropantoate 2-reductase [Candidatus Sulfotelmatobacter sp.]
MSQQDQNPRPVSPESTGRDKDGAPAALRHAILGAGGVGGTIGACLAHAGASVTLVVRPETVAKHPKQLNFESPLGKFTVDVAVAAEVPTVDVLWITVKATQLDQALGAFRNPDGVRAIVPLLNGIDHVALLRSKYGASRVIPATIAGEMERVSPGRILHRSPFLRLNVLAAGRPLLEGTLDQFSKLGLTCRFIDEEATLLWGKLVFLAPFALSTTAADKTVGEVLSDPKWRSLGEACVREACAVGVAEGAKVDADTVLPGVSAMPAGMKSSMQKDVEQGRTPELDAIAGPILRGGRKHGIDVPATRKLVALVEERAGYKESRLA